MRRRALAAWIFALGAAAFSNARAGESPYDCFQTKAAGFVHADSVRWFSGTFKAETKYVLRPMTEEEKAGRAGAGGKYKWMLVETAPGHLTTACAYDASGHDIVCNDVVHFRMNVTTMQFIESYAHGYIDGPGDTGDTPYIAIGFCAKQ
jgi:hypothetical protein